MSSKRLRCAALVAAIFVVAASPAAAQDPDPLPAPPLPAPDPAPPAPPPAPARPAPVKKPAAKPAPAPARVTPAVAPTIVTTPPTQPRRSAPVRAKSPTRAAKPVVASPPEPLRRLPIRDASTPHVEETTLVLTAARVGDDDGGFGAIGLVTVFWLGLAAALLILAYAVRFAEVPQPWGLFFYERRGVLALIGVNMAAMAAVCYVIVATA